MSEHQDRIEIEPTADGQFMAKRVAPNNETLSWTESYTRRGDAEQTTTRTWPDLYDENTGTPHG